MAVHACDFSTWETEIRETVVQGQPPLQNMFKASLGITRPCLFLMPTDIKITWISVSEAVSQTFPILTSLLGKEVVFFNFLLFIIL